MMILYLHAQHLYVRRFVTHCYLGMSKAAASHINFRLLLFNFFFLFGFVFCG